MIPFTAFLLPVELPHPVALGGPLGVVLLLLAALAAGLLVLNHRLRRANRAVKQQMAIDQTLRASEAFYRDLLEQQGEGFAVVDENEIFMFTNPVADQIFGLSPGGLLGRSLLEFLDPDQEAVVHQETRKRLQGERSSYQLRIRRPSGEERILQITVTPRRAEATGDLAVIGVFRDITELRRALEELRVSEAQNKALLSAIPDLLFMNDRQGLYLTAYASDPSLLYVPPEAFLNRHVREVLPEPQATSCMNVIAEALDQDRVVDWNYSLPIEGTEAFFEARVAPCGPDKVLFLVREVTAKIQAERQQAEFQVQLLQSQKLESLGSLAGGIAHDMNNVLGAILSLASTQESLQARDPQARQAFATIAEAADRGGRMVKSLLAFARQHPAEERELDLNEVLRQNLSLLEHTTLAKVRLETDLAPSLRPIKGDASALANAFMNLCVNAVDAMGSNGVLTLTTRNLEPGLVEVVVEDSGPGMSPDVVAKAMDPFFTTKETGKGTGLGLSLVYSTVKAHQGQVELQSEPGRGTRVHLRFPACGPHAPSAAPPAETAQVAAGRALRVLLVDDDELVRMSTEMLLESLGHDLRITCSGEEALAAVEEGYRPEVVILDMNMPGLGGVGTLPRLRALCPDVPVLLATGRADQEALNLIERHPHVVLLAKPFSIATMRRELASLQPV